MKEKIKFGNLETVFKALYIGHLLLAFDALVNRTMITQITSGLVLVLGVIVVLRKLMTLPQCFKRKNIIILNCFLISYLISAIANMEFGLISSLKGFVWLFFQIWILYFVSDGTDIKKEFKIVGNTYVSIVTLQNIIGVLMFLGGVSYRNVSESGEIHMLGFFWGRLWGVYDDPNHGAVISAAAVLVALGLVHFAKSQKMKRLYVFSIVMQIIYIVLSDSRTGSLCLAIGIVLVTTIKKMYSKNEINIICWIKSLILSVLAVCIIVLCVAPLQNGLGVVGNFTSKIAQSFYVGEGKEGEDPIEVGRDDVSSDPSNRRFDIWKSAVEVFETSPVWGTGWSNVNPYAHKYVPETYVVNNDYKEFWALHNVFFDVLAGQGIIGMIIFVGLIISSVFFMIKNYKAIQKKDYYLMTILFSILVIMVFAGLLISFIFYVNSPESFIFWMTFGYFMVMLQKANETIIDKQ